MRLVLRGYELQPGDVWHGRLIVEVNELRTIPASVLHDCIADAHPEGLPGRTVYFVGASGRVPCTVFDDDRYDIVRPLSPLELQEALA